MSFFVWGLGSFETARECRDCRKPSGEIVKTAAELDMPRGKPCWRSFGKKKRRREGKSEVNDPDTDRIYLSVRRSRLGLGRGIERIDSWMQVI